MAVHQGRGGGGWATAVLGRGCVPARSAALVYLLQKDGERWGLGGLILALVGVVQRLRCCLCTAESGLAPPAWADAQALRCPKERSRSPHRSGGRAGGAEAG